MGMQRIDAVPLPGSEHNLFKRAFQSTFEDWNDMNNPLSRGSLRLIIPFRSERQKAFHIRLQAV